LFAFYIKITLPGFGFTKGKPSVSCRLLYILRKVIIRKLHTGCRSAILKGRRRIRTKGYAIIRKVDHSIMQMAFSILMLFISSEKSKADKIKKTWLLVSLQADCKKQRMRVLPLKYDLVGIQTWTFQQTRACEPELPLLYKIQANKNFRQNEKNSISYRSFGWNWQSDCHLSRAKWL
jgi:hypothetical protein